MPARPDTFPAQPHHADMPPDDGGVDSYVSQLLAGGQPQLPVEDSFVGTRRAIQSEPDPTRAAGCTAQGYHDVPESSYAGDSPEREPVATEPQAVSPQLPMTGNERGFFASPDSTTEDAKRSSPVDPNLALRLQIAEAEARAAHHYRQASRAEARGKTIHTVGMVLKVGAVAAAGVGLFLGGKWLLGMFLGHGDHPKPAQDLPTPEAAVAELKQVDDLTFLKEVGVTGTANTSVRLSVLGIDTHVGHDVGAHVTATEQFVVPGNDIQLGVSRDASGKTHLTAHVTDPKITVQFVDPQITYPKADSQWVANAAATFHINNGMNYVLGLANTNVTATTEAECGNVVLNAGANRGEALGGALGNALRQDVGRLVNVLKETDSKAADVLENLISKDNPVEIDFDSANGPTLDMPQPPKNVSVSNWGANLDLIFGQAKSCGFSDKGKSELTDAAKHPGVIVRDTPQITPLAGPR